MADLKLQVRLSARDDGLEVTVRNADKVLAGLGRQEDRVDAAGLSSRTRGNLPVDSACANLMKKKVAKNP